MKAFYTEETTKTTYHLTEYAKQKLLGLLLVIIGIIACAVFKEDATAGVMIAFLGILRLIG